MSGAVLEASFNGVEEFESIISRARLAKKRWRLAYTTVYITNHLCSFRNNILAKKFLRPPSYLAIDVEPEQPEQLSSISQSSLSVLVKEKNANQLLQLGQVEGVVKALKSDAGRGIRGDVEDIAIRRKIFGSNSYRKAPAKTAHMVTGVVVEAFKDPIILILLVFAALSLGFGIKKQGSKGWSDGGSILGAVLLVVAVSALINFWPKNELNKLSQPSENIHVDVTRNGQTEQIHIFNLVVGDVVWLKVGDQVPADGLLLDRDSLQVDESSMTGDSDPITVNSRENPFLLSGTKVVDGNARMLVTSVGMNTEWGQIMRSISCDSYAMTPLQAELKKLTSVISMVGVLVSFLVLVILLTRYFMGDTYADDGCREFTSGKTNIHDVLNSVAGILVTAVAMAAAAIPEGFLFAVKVTLAYSTKRILANRAVVRKLSACEAMGCITVICTDLRGTLSTNHMKVTKFWLGWEYTEDSSSSFIASDILELLKEGIGLNETQHQSGSLPDLTNKAVHEWGIRTLGMEVEELKGSCDILYTTDQAFNSETKRSSVLIRKKADKTIHVHHKGAPEGILGMCSHYHDVTGVIEFFNHVTRKKLLQKIQEMATNGLQCVAFAHKQTSYEDDYDGQFSPELEEGCLIFLGVVGCKHPVREAVIECQKAGVKIKLITGDDISAAKAVATECGIIELKDDMNTGEVVEGVGFRSCTHEKRMEKIEEISVIARASPLDKLLIVECLKQRGYVVAVTGDGTADAWAFRKAHVGLSMGSQSTGIAKESSGIVILDDDFVSVVRVLRWSRGVFINIQTFTQFQLTVSFASLVIDFVTAVSASEPPTIKMVAAISAGTVPYATLQLLWLKLIIGTFAALALTVEQPTNDSMQKPPIDCSKPFITKIMWRNILSQALYQVAILLIIQFQGESIFSVTNKVKDTLIFNSFVLLQIFMIVSARKLEGNVVKGIQGKKLFWGIIGIILVLQVLMVKLLKRFAHTERLSWGQWGACIGIATGSWIFDWLIKYIPVEEPSFEDSW